MIICNRVLDITFDLGGSHLPDVQTFRYWSSISKIWANKEIVLSLYLISLRENLDNLRKQINGSEEVHNENFIKPQADTLEKP